MRRLGAGAGCAELFGEFAKSIERDGRGDLVHAREVLVEHGLAVLDLGGQPPGGDASQPSASANLRAVPTIKRRRAERSRSRRSSMLIRMIASLHYTSAAIDVRDGGLALLA